MNCNGDLKQQKVSHFNGELVHNTYMYNVQLYEMIKICTNKTKHVLYQ